MSNNTDRTNVVDTIINAKKKLTFINKIKFTKVKGEAVIIGDNIKLLDFNLKPISDISNLSGKIVNIRAVSDSLFNQAEDFEGFCKSYWYVEIEKNKTKGIVNGRNIFKILDEKKYTIKGNIIEIFRTEFFGMGVTYEGDLMGCPVNQPIVIKDTVKKYYGLVNLVSNQYSKEANRNTSYPFLELKSDDGALDEIETIIENKNYVTLKVNRTFQEGNNISEIKLQFENEKYIAEYLNFGEIKYE